jgi:hypothetical protein
VTGPVELTTTVYSISPKDKLDPIPLFQLQPSHHEYLYVNFFVLVGRDVFLECQHLPLGDTNMYAQLARL